MEAGGWFSRRMLAAGIFAAGVGATGLAAGAAGGAGDDWSVVVRPGDTLVDISGRYLADPNGWRRLQRANRVSDPRRLQPGARLRIPVAWLRSDPVVADVLLANGDAARIASGVEASVRSGDALRAGETVRVGADSNLSLRFPDGSRVLVLANSRFRLAKAVRLGGVPLYRIHLELLEGNVESIVAPMPDKAGQYEVRTPALRMAVRGTVFRAAVPAQTQAARSEVISGRVEISALGAARILEGGYGSQAAAGEAPRVPVTLAPPPQLVALPGRVEGVPLRFSWPPAEAAKAYRAQVLDAGGNLVLDGVFPGNSARWPDLPDAAYTLRVRVIAGDGFEGVDATHAFVLKARPEAPIARQPLAKAWGETTEFHWAESVSGGSYHFQLARDTQFSQPLVDRPALTAPTTSAQLPPGSYFWRLASIDRNGDRGPFGDAVAFVQRPIPASPAAAAPELDDTKLRFQWQAGEAGQSYRVQIARQPDFGQPLLDTTTVSGSVAVDRPPPGDYYLRVQAVDADGFAGPFGAAQRVSVPPPPLNLWWLPLLLVPLLL